MYGGVEAKLRNLNPFPTRFTLNKRDTVRTEYDTVWAPQLKWTLKKRKILLAVPGIERQSLGNPHLNTLPTTLSLINRRRGQKGLEEGKNERKMLRLS